MSTTNEGRIGLEVIKAGFDTLYEAISHVRPGDFGKPLSNLLLERQF